MTNGWFGDPSKGRDTIWHYLGNVCLFWLPVVIAFSLLAGFIKVLSVMVGACHAD